MHSRARRFLRTPSISGRQNLPSRYGASSVPTIPLANAPRETSMRVVLQRSMEQTGSIVQYIDLIRQKYDVWLLCLYWQKPKDVYISNYPSKFGCPKLWLLQYHLETTAYCENQHQPWFNRDSCLHKQDMT